MKRTATILLILVLLLAAFGLYFYLSEKKGSLSQRDRNFRIPGEDTEVVRIEMQRQNGELLLLEKDPSGIWQVNNHFRANESAVRELLGTLRHLTVRLPVALADQDQVNDALEQEGVLVTIYARTPWIRLPGGLNLIPRTKRIQRLLTGDDTPDGESTYMRLYRSDMPFAVHVPGIEGGLADLFSTGETSWRDPVVLDLASKQIQSVEVNFPEREDESYRLEQQSDEIHLFHKGQKVDPALVDWPKVSRFLDSFTEMHYEKLLTGEDDSLRLREMRSPFFLEISVTAQNGQTTRMRFFYREASSEMLQDLAPGTDTDPNRFYLQVNDGAFALAQYFVFSRIIRPFSFFLLNPESAENS
ncbi:MAG: DUF4340 domain-containing protein [Bacteroides sp.]|jgi:hypothetical protein|nr:DUF4340 domain-containing protein [Bacteroides sp.]